MKSALTNVWRAGRVVFSRWRYAAAAILIAFLFLFSSIWMKNLPWLWRLLAVGKFKIFAWTIENFGLNFTPVRAVFTVVIAVLLGINLAMLSFYFKQRRAGAAAVGASGLGLAMSILGVGCAACGSVVLTSVLGYAAAAKFLGALPGRGLEFSVISLALLWLSIAMLSQKIITIRS